MQYKDTSQQAFLFRPIYFICILLFIYFELGTVDLGEFLIWKVEPHTKKCGHPWCKVLGVDGIQILTSMKLLRVEFVGLCVIKNLMFL